MESCNLLLSTHIPTISLQPHCRLAFAPVQARSLKSRVCASSMGGRREVYSGGGVYAPLQVRSPTGKYLGTLLQDKTHEYFETAAKHQLLRLSDDYERTTQLMNSIDTNQDNANICKSVTEGVKREIELEVEETMYMLICSRFLEAGVHMLPRISDCMVEGRLELSNSRDCCQLEYVHTPEVLELVKLYITCVTELDADSSARDHWKLIHTDHCYLTMIYTFAILHGHFLKSASSRYALEQLFNEANEATYQKMSLSSYALKIPPGLRLKQIAPKSIVAKNMMNKHLKVLFSQVKMHPASTEGRITMSLGTLKRLALEGLAFGTFMWDTEYFVNKFYKLEDGNVLPIF